MHHIYQGYEPEEIQILVQIRRLIERLKGDPGFRRMVCGVPAERSELLSDLGIRIDPAELKPIWRDVQEGYRTSLKKSDLTKHPALRLWLEWKKTNHEHSGRLSEEWSSSDIRLDAWRKRQIQRIISETGLFSQTSFLPLFAYELSKGCSIGCWFCGFDAESFQGFFPYTKENALLWREILSIGLDLFGPLSRDSVCYHGTEPFDNPDYLSFLRDFNDLYGVYPQTTTAAPLRDLQRTQELLRLRESCPLIPDRFSVLSLSSLKRIHETFSPYELRYVKLELHNKGALKYKSNCGRARRYPQQLTEANALARECDPVENPLDPLTTDCVCGYLVNLVERSVKLISPCMATDQWPNGYRIHAEGIFQDAAQYKAFLERTVEEFMPAKLEWKVNVSFRHDLQYERLDDGFTLTSRFYRHSMKGKVWHGALGDLIAQGETSAGEIITTLASDGAPLLEVTSAMQKIFERGLLEDDPSPAQSSEP